MTAHAFSRSKAKFISFRGNVIEPYPSKCNITRNIHMLLVGINKYGGGGREVSLEEFLQGALLQLNFLNNS